MDEKEQNNKCADCELVESGPVLSEEQKVEDGSSVEPTLTDHLNKRLLTSFLDRLNQIQPNANSSTETSAFDDDLTKNQDTDQLA